MITDPEILKKLIQQGSLLPKEEMLEIARKKGSGQDIPTIIYDNE